MKNRKDVIRKKVEETIENAIILAFYKAKENCFNGKDTCIYLGFFKNKLIILNPKTEYIPNLRSLVKIGNPKLFGTKAEHASNLIGKLNEVQQTQISHMSSYSDHLLAVDIVWSYVHKVSPYACEAYFENYLRDCISKIRKTKTYRQLSNRFTDTFLANTEKCTDFETSRLIAELIQTFGYTNAYPEVDSFAEDLYISNVFTSI